MTLKRHVVTAGPTVAGAVTVYSPVINGRVISIRYVKVDYANGVDFAITAEVSGEGLWTEANVDAATFRRPRAPVHDAVGVVVASAYEAVLLVKDRIKFAITNGGNTKTATFEVLVDENP